MRPILEFRNISKEYVLGSTVRRHENFREVLVRTLQSPLRLFHRGHHNPFREERFWALRDISFDVNPGDVIGIIGPNGAGKSTLLKIMSRITDPTEGHINIRGRLASLLEVGTGFHPELTGRENIYLNGSILGMKKTEIDRKFDEIVTFAEVERFLDTPVKHYSSGMYVRLAFAVAAHMETDILLVDEVLAVGDAAFQKRCLGKMGDVAKEGRTVLFVSHSMGAVTALCNHTIWFEGGKIEAAGPTAEIVTAYFSEVFQSTEGDLDKLRLPGLGKEARILAVELLTNDGSNLMFGESLRYRLVVW